MLTPHDPTFAICDSMPLPACLGKHAPTDANASEEKRLAVKDTLLRQTLYGFRVHVRILWRGMITRFSVTPANAHELSVVPELVERTRGVVVADRNYWSPPLREQLAERGVELATSYRTNKYDPNPKRSAYLSQLRYGSTATSLSSQSATP